MRIRFGQINPGKDTSGVATIEFALLAPLVITMMMAIFQVGIAMQNYNAMRGASGDIARYSMIEAQKSNFLNNADLTTKARAIATSSPYQLISSQLTVNVTQPTDQRVDGATEKTISMTYNVPIIFGWNSISLRYNRPVFLIN